MGKQSEVTGDETKGSIGHGQMTAQQNIITRSSKYWMKTI